MTDLQALGAQIKGLSPADQLRVCVDLLERAKTEADPARARSFLRLVDSILRPIATEISALCALDLLKGKS